MFPVVAPNDRVLHGEKHCELSFYGGCGDAGTMRRRKAQEGEERTAETGDACAKVEKKKKSYFVEYLVES